MAFGDVKPTSALGHKRTLRQVLPMSAIPPKADNAPHGIYEYTPYSFVAWAAPKTSGRLMLLLASRMGYQFGHGDLP
jgi:hypothetical protein